jgi:U3 small nucleolar RNA-associated protein 12
MVKAYLRYV